MKQCLFKDLTVFGHAYFRKFSIHAYFQKGAYYRASTVSQKNLLHKVCSQYRLCIIQFSFRPILSQEILAENRKNRRNFFGSKLVKKKIMQSKYGEQTL